jgi:hypothetical protein
MRRIISILSIATAVCVASAGSADAAVKHPCQAKSSITVRSTKLVRAYDVFNSSLDATLHYACYKPKNRRTYIGETTNPGGPNGTYSFDQSHVESATKVVLRDRFAANSTSDCVNPAYFRDGRVDCQTRVTVWNLRTGKVVHDHFASANPPGQTYETTVNRIVLQTTGSVAWGTTDARVQGGSRVFLNKEIASMTGPAYNLLAYGDNVNAGSLALSGSTISWLEDTTKHTATLR